MSRVNFIKILRCKLESGRFKGIIFLSYFNLNIYLHICNSIKLKQALILLPNLKGGGSSLLGRARNTFYLNIRLYESHTFLFEFVQWYLPICTL